MYSKNDGLEELIEYETVICPLRGSGRRSRRKQ